MAAGETVLYYNPDEAAKPTKLTGVLFRMKVRIRRVKPEEILESVGYLAGLKGFEQGGGASGTTAPEPGAAESTSGAAAGVPGSTANAADANCSAGEANMPDEGSASDGNETSDGENAPRATALPRIDEEMLVMSNFSNSRLNELLAQMRKAGAPRIALKAMVTPTNCRWSFYDLYKEIREEHEALNQPREQ